MTDTSILNAVAWAAFAHRGQRRFGMDVAQVNHPIEVAWIVQHIGGIQDEKVLCAAVLHDVVEDSNLTDSDIRGEFGNYVADLVYELTDNEGLSKEERYAHQALHVHKMSAESQAIKVADQAHNVMSIRMTKSVAWDTDRCFRYVDKATTIANNAFLCPTRLSTYYTSHERMTRAYLRERSNCTDVECVDGTLICARHRRPYQWVTTHKSTHISWGGVNPDRWSG